MNGRRIVSSGLVIMASILVLGAACRPGEQGQLYEPGGKTGDADAPTAVTGAGPSGLSLGVQQTSTTLPVTTVSSARVLTERDIIPVKVGASWGLIDSTGTWVARPRFANAPLFSEGLAAVQCGTADVPGLWGFIDPGGEWVIEPRFENARAFAGGLAPVAVRTRMTSCSGGSWTGRVPGPSSPDSLMPGPSPRV